MEARSPPHAGPQLRADPPDPPKSAPVPNVKLKGIVPQASAQPLAVSFLARHFPAGPQLPSVLSKQWILPSFPSSRPSIPLSAIAQMDGLLHSCLGVRIERDVCASSLEQAFCGVFGRSALLAASTYVGLYVCQFDMLAATVNVVATNNGCGLFIVPTWPDHGPQISTTKNSRPLSWFRTLKAHARVEFLLSSDFWLRS